MVWSRLLAPPLRLPAVCSPRPPPPHPPALTQPPGPSPGSGQGYPADQPSFREWPRPPRATCSCPHASRLSSCWGQSPRQSLCGHTALFGSSRLSSWGISAAVVTRAVCAFAARWLSGGTSRVRASEGASWPSRRLGAPRGVRTGFEEWLWGARCYFLPQLSNL